MLPGPVFNVELLTTSRRPRYYAFRVVYGLALLILVWINYSGWDRGRGVEMSPEMLRAFAWTTFGSLVALQGGLIVFMTPALVAGVIANEKQRKTLHYLLASRLSSSEIVLGKLLARMLHAGVFLAVGLPILSILSLFGGVDPKYVLLSAAGTMSCAFFLASLSVLCSTVSKRVREAISATYALEIVWLLLPPLILGTMPMTYPTLYEFVQPVNDWLMASTPWGPMTALSGSILVSGVEPVVRATFWMVVLQVAAGVVLLGLAVWRLRPVFQAQEGSKGFRLLGFTFGGGTKSRLRLFARRPVGDEAMIWKELHTSRTSGTAQVIGMIVSLVVVSAVAYWTFFYARDSFNELASMRYDVLGSDRANFNAFLRFLTTAIGTVCLLAVGVGGANSMTSEREDDTWISLVSTPLEASDIVLPKFFGVLWKVRHALILAAVLWLIGMVCGAVHPLGVLFEAVELAAFLGFGAAMGTYFSIRAKSTWRSQVTTIGVLLVLNGGYLMCCCPVFFSNRPTIAIFAGVTPFIEAVSLIEPVGGGQRVRDVRRGPEQPQSRPGRAGPGVHPRHAGLRDRRLLPGRRGDHPVRRRRRPPPPRLEPAGSPTPGQAPAAREQDPRPGLTPRRIEGLPFFLRIR